MLRKQNRQIYTKDTTPLTVNSLNPVIVCTIEDT